MTAQHRHLDYPATTPPHRLPLAAVVDLLDRGDLDDWLPIARAVADDPHGPFAREVERLVDAFPMYGTSRLWRAWIDRARAAAPAGPARTLAELRRDHGLTQVELAERLGMSQSDLSKLERRGDLRVSTLEAVVQALGGRLQLLVRDGGCRRQIRVGPGDSGLGLTPAGAGEPRSERP